MSCKLNESYRRGSFNSSNDDSSLKSVESGTNKSHFTAYSSCETNSSRVSSATKEDNYVNPVVAKREQKAVFFWSLGVVAVLIIAFTALSATMFRLVRISTKAEFETQFNIFAFETASLVQDNCKSAIDSAESFSTMVTSSANEMNHSWPYVSITDFTSKAKRLATLSGAYQIGFAPIIYPEHSSGWPLHAYWNLPSYYEEAIEVHGYDKTVGDMVNVTIPFVWHNDPVSGLPKPTDLQEPEVPIQLTALRENIGFDGFFVNWQSLEPIYGLYGRELAVTNLNLLYSGFEGALTTAYRFNIPAFEFFMNPVSDPDTFEVIGYESQTQMVHPIFDTIYNGDKSRKEMKMVGALTLLIDWTTLLSNLVSMKDISDIDVVLRSSCSQLVRPVTFRVTRDAVIEVGAEDLHDRQYNDLAVNTTLFKLDLDDETQAELDRQRAEQATSTVEGDCISEIFMSIYPTQELEDSFTTNQGWILTGWVGAIFFFTSIVFFCYDTMVRRRQKKVMDRIIQQDKIVLNTFPKAIRDKLYKDAKDEFNDSGKLSVYETNNTDDNIFGSRQLADLYPNATVVFADIVGFTAWSSAREPNQVFKLLETIYKEFDKIAYRHNIYKVETVGDCYVAVAGVPEKCDDHALAVAKFARGCMQKMPSLVGKLEILLGPDTADLQLRIGLNTGQVTAGVLRGDKARFQLFGDTVNTASRMETTSQAGYIHVSAATADALIKDGRKRWLRPRRDTVLVKGKGQMQTFYLETVEDSLQRAKLEKYKKTRPSDGLITTLASSVITEEGSTDFEDEVSSHEDHFDQEEGFDMHRVMSKSDRLVEWNIEILSYLLKQILVARPDHLRDVNTTALALFENDINDDRECAPTTVLDEFQEIIELPDIGREEMLQRKHPSTIELKPIVVEQLRDLLKNIASMYNDNAFHNFEHASHVTASVRKLLTRIVDADHTQQATSDKDLDKFAIKFKQNIKLEDRTFRLRTYKQVFVGTEAVDYLITSGAAKSRKDAIELGKALQRRNIFEHVCQDHDFEDEHFFYRMLDTDGEAQKDNLELVDLSGHSYGITSDPLTQFAVVFSAVIHDADHPGVPNTQLVKENTRLAQIYRKSIAEQNSVELVWDLLMSSDYEELRSCIYSSKDELQRFRQLVVNTVMATDIVDKELQTLRKMRWEKAFSFSDDEANLKENRKATIVIEHLIQASDVSHTMQHWNIYRKWNEKFFFELYDAYRSGRAETDPSINWYKGEIGFFDFYIIPLAKKLQSCGVFGVSSDEYLNYAQSNREEWVREGEQVVKDFLAKYHETRDSTEKSLV